MRWLLIIKKQKPTLAGMAEWIECRPANQRVTSSIPSLGHMPGLRVRSLVGGAGEATDVSLPLFLPPFPSLKINKILKKKSKGLKITLINNLRHKGDFLHVLVKSHFKIITI